jgi:hypothetical protein
MIKMHKNFIIMMFFLSIEVFLCIATILVSISLFKEPLASKAAAPIREKSISNPAEKRGSPTYDTIIGSDGWPHYRVFFWVPKTAKNFVPYADEGVKTDVSSHGPAEKWSVVETKTVNGNEKLIFIYVPKTFVYLYGKGFEKVIHLRYSE